MKANDGEKEREKEIESGKDGLAHSMSHEVQPPLAGASLLPSLRPAGTEVPLSQRVVSLHQPALLLPEEPHKRVRCPAVMLQHRRDPLLSPALEDPNIGTPGQIRRLKVSADCSLLRKISSHRRLRKATMMLLMTMMGPHASKPRLQRGTWYPLLSTRRMTWMTLGKQ